MSTTCVSEIAFVDKGEERAATTIAKTSDIRFIISVTKYVYSPFNLAD